MPYEPELINIEVKWTERKKEEAQRNKSQVMEDFSIAVRAENRVSRGGAVAQRQIDRTRLANPTSNGFDLAEQLKYLQRGHERFALTSHPSE